MTPADPKSDTLARYLRLSPVIPVLTVEDREGAVALARTLVEAGLPVLEVTLRTESALRAIESIARAVPDAVMAAGTVLTPGQAGAAAAAGARFLVTPGTPPALARALSEAELPALPGCATPGEAMALADLGFRHLKFFPAAASGGVAWLGAVEGPLPGLSFCPTGGIGEETAPAYLARPNVACVGGSWMVPRQAVAARDWPQIGELARRAASLAGQGRRS